jgi:hypothetical protein
VQEQSATGDATEGRYELVISVDVRGSGTYDNPGKRRMRARFYRIMEGAFARAGVGGDALHREDRGDGLLASVAGRIGPARLLGLWTVEVNELLRAENEGLSPRMGLRIGMHVGPVQHDPEGISGQAVDLACRLADSDTARQLLDRDRADLVLAVSDSLFREVVGHGGRFIDPACYASTGLVLKEGPATAWFTLPGRSRPDLTGLSEPSGPPDGGGGTANGTDRTSTVRGPAGPKPTAGAGAGGRSGAAADVAADVAGMVVHGDMSHNHDNEYLGDVHIGRTVNNDGTARPGTSGHRD